MALWRLYYHFVWSTKERRDLITPEMEPDLYGYIIGKAVALGAIVHAIGGIPNHTHLVASVPPTLALAEFVKGVKGSSAHHVNHGPIRYALTFGWQGGYGVFSLGRKQLDATIAYVQNQKAHHAQGTLVTALELETNDEDRPGLWQEGAAIHCFPAPRRTEDDHE